MEQSPHVKKSEGQRLTLRPFLVKYLKLKIKNKALKAEVWDVDSDNKKININTEL